MLVAVVDPLPLYCQGVAAALAAHGFDVETPHDVLAWFHETSRGVLLLTLAAARDWSLLARLTDLPSRCDVIGLTADGSVEAGVRAIRLGVRSVLSRDVTGDVLRHTIEATARGQAVMPSAVATALAGAGSSEPAGVSAEQVTWLRRLSEGETIAQLARHAGYSERAMFRLLQSLYQALGVHNRMQAVMYALEQGWLQSDPPDRRA
ncbi:DNA-binding response regulator [Dactylosporangium sp. NPDC005555]|uniref:DNA-binding response regulator n=1 Tax=Dactylosporangium sp. NPDC005555 TaxID=3154889 RepID=UPI0033A6ADAF